MKEQFIDFAFMMDIDLSSKFAMSYRLRCLLNESLNLSNYGKSILTILFSPIIGSVLDPENSFDALEKELRLEFYIAPEAVIEATEEAFFIMHIEGLLAALEQLPLTPENFDFDFEKFKEDLEALKPKFNQLKEVV